MRFYRIILSFLLISLCAIIRAQSLSVESFRLLENDLTANTNGTMEYDQNGNVAALIRVVTSETGFSFDAGMLGVVKTTQKTGEIWVYVPFGLQRITIAHQELGVIRNYYFPVPIERARTYELRLKDNRINIQDNYKYISVTFINPNNRADLYLEGNSLGSGDVKARLRTLTDYSIEIKKEGYNTYVDTIRLTQDMDGREIVIPKLKPITGTLQLNSQPSGAKVRIDGVLVGETPLTEEGLPIGARIVDIKKRGYYNYHTFLTVTEQKIYDVDVILKEKKYLDKHLYYFGAGYETGHLKGLMAYAGIYLWNINIEGGYFIPKTTPETTLWITSSDSWTGSSTQLAYDFIPEYAINGSVGYGLQFGKRMRFTPQMGLMYYLLNGTFAADKSSNFKTTIDADDNKTSTYVMSGRCALRLEFCPISHVSLSVTPSYELPVNKGSIAKKIDSNSDIIKRWCGGLGIRTGIEINF